MIFNSYIDIYELQKVSDTIGGYTEEEVFLKRVECKKHSMSTSKQKDLIGVISKTALTVITNTPINEDCIIKIDNTSYEILRVSQAFNKFSVDLEVLNNV